MFCASIVKFRIRSKYFANYSWKEIKINFVIFSILYYIDFMCLKRSWWSLICVCFNLGMNIMHSNLSWKSFWSSRAQLTQYVFKSLTKWWQYLFVHNTIRCLNAAYLCSLYIVQCITKLLLFIYNSEAGHTRKWSGSNWITYTHEYSMDPINYVMLLLPPVWAIAIAFTDISW